MKWTLAFLLFSIPVLGALIDPLPEMPITHTLNEAKPFHRTVTGKIITHPKDGFTCVETDKGVYSISVWEKDLPKLQALTCQMGKKITFSGTPYKHEQSDHPEYPMLILDEGENFKVENE